MNIVVLVSMLIGVCLALVGWIWSIFAANKVGGGWVLGMLLIALITIPLFALTHWDKAKRPFIVWGIGSVLLIGAIVWINVTGK